ncbi:MAG TPA: SIMPL domain-containing protein [Tepidisphaeraceae bacterium]|jgi:uncharacterized protein YggE
MRYRSTCFLAGAWALALILPAAAPAQPAAAGAANGVVSGTGIASIERKPDVLRLSLDIAADGKDMKDALAKLRALQEAAKKKLGELGADAKSIDAGDVQTNGAASARQEQMARMMRQRGGGRKPASAPAAMVHLSSTIKAEWPLTGSGDELLVSSAELVRKVKAADLSGKKTASPAEQEEAEEGEQQYMDETGQAAAGEPVVMFIAKISPDEQAKATAEAFKKAKDECARLAKAAGVELNNLQTLSSRAMPMGMDQDYNQYARQYQQYAYRMMQQLGNGEEGVTPTEAVGMQPTKVSMTVTVTASFGIK